jgi:CheY-like chemotaxis protein
MTGENIMIVDDEPAILGVLSSLLTSKGYKVSTANSGQDALERLKTIKPDLMLIDFFMPTISGRALAEKMRADPSLKDIRIIFITAASFSDAGVKELEKLQIKDYIKKPFDNKDLIERIRKILKD